MISKEEYMRRVLRNTIRDAVQTLLRTKEFSDKFLIRNDTKEIDKEVETISESVVSKLIAGLKQRGFLEEGKEISSLEFEEIFQNTMKEYFSERHEGKDNTK